MKIIELINLYIGMPVDERSDFEKFLKSPYFVKVKSTKDFYKDIMKHVDLIAVCSYEKFLKKLQTKYKLSDNDLSKRFTYLSKITLDYLKVKTLLSKDTEANLAVLERLLEENKTNIVKKKLPQLSDDIIRKKMFERNHLPLSYRYNILCHDYLLKTGDSGGRKIANEEYDHLLKATSDMSLFSLTELTTLYANCFFLDVNTGNRELYPFPINLEILFKEYEDKEVFKADKQSSRIFELYKLMYLSIQHRNVRGRYLEYKNYAIKCLKYLSGELVKYHYLILINFCVLKDRLGEDRDYYRKESVELLYDYFNKGYYKIGSEHIHHISFSNFIVKAFSIGDYDIIKSFIDNNSKELNPADYNNMVNYGLSYYYFGKRDYLKCLKHVNSIPIKDFYYKFDILNLELRIYYELKKDDLVYKALHNYRKRIFEDQTLTSADKKSLIKMLNYFYKLISLYFEPDKSKRVLQSGYTLNEIKRESTFALKNWLIEKYSDLTGSTSTKQSTY